jgi:hypothetical protein
MFWIRWKKINCYLLILKFLGVFDTTIRIWISNQPDP